MIKFKLALEASFFNAVMYLVSGAGTILTFATFAVATHLFVSYKESWLYDWVPWVFGTTMWATGLPHYCLHRAETALSFIDKSAEKYTSAIKNKDNNSFVIGVFNGAIIFFSILLVVISYYHGFGGGLLRLFVQLSGGIYLIGALAFFALSKTAAESRWLYKMKD